MTGKLKPKPTTFQILGENYTAKFSIGFFYDLEEHFGYNGLSGDFWDNFSSKKVVALLVTIMLQSDPELNVQQAVKRIKANMDLSELEEFKKSLQEATKSAKDDTDQASEELTQVEAKK